MHYILPLRFCAKSPKSRIRFLVNMIMLHAATKGKSSLPVLNALGVPDACKNSQKRANLIMLKRAIWRFSLAVFPYIFETWHECNHVYYGESWINSVFSAIEHGYVGGNTFSEEPIRFVLLSVHLLHKIIFASLIKLAGNKLPCSSRVIKQITAVKTVPFCSSVQCT